MPISIADVLNRAGEPTYRPSSEKSSMSEINQPILGELKTLPPKNTTQHSYTNGSNHEANSSEEDQAGVKQDTMVVDEEVQAGDNPEDGSPNIEGTVDTNQEGNDGEDMVMEEKDKGNQTPLNVGDDDGGFEEEDNNSEYNQETSEGQTQSQTLATPTVAATSEGRVSTGGTRGFSSEELAILKRNQPLEYLKVMLSYKESSSKKSLSTATTSDDQPSSTPTDEVLSKIKEKVFKGDLFLLLLTDPYAPLTLKALLNQVNLIEACPEVANIILELGTMVDQVVEDYKLLPQITREIEQKAGFEVAAWDASFESTNKAMKLEQAK